MVNFQYYDPKEIFVDNENPEGMAGETNVHLAASFFHSRNQGKCHECNSLHERHNEFNRNAGAVQLYKEDGLSVYPISAQLKNKEYHCISYGNKNFKRITKYSENVKASAYGHSERMLMRDILDDLVRAKDPDHENLVPSNNSRSSNCQEREFEILKYLKDNAGKYKDYLNMKHVVVKMWSERPTCTAENNGEKGIGGGNCTKFMEDILPDGSQVGYIVENYEENDEKKIEAAFTEFAEAYRTFVNICP